MNIKNYLKIILYNFLVSILIILTIFIVILFTELFSGRYLSKDKLDCSYLHCNADYKYVNRTRESTLAVATPLFLLKKYEDFYNISYQKDEYGFRGRKKNVSSIDIISVGGSTTDEKFLNVEDTWSEQLEDKFTVLGKDIDVVNAGIVGQSTHGHIWNLKNWFPKIKNFKTKYIIFYIGINEKLEDKPLRVYDLSSENLTLKQKIKYYIQRNNGFLYQIYNFFTKKYYNLNMNLGYDPLYPKYSEVKNNFIPTKKQELNLKNNLIIINQLTRDLDAIPIFVTQRTQYWKKINNQILAANNVLNNKKNHLYSYKFEKFISETIVKFCDEYNVLCIDVFKDIKFEEDDLFELTHTTARGSKKIANLIYEKIIQNYNFE